MSIFLEPDMGYEHRYHHRQHHSLHKKNTHIHIHIQHRSSFLPMLCSRPSIKDVSVPRPVALSSDPMSPKIGCMGQVKRNNKIVGYPVSHRISLNAKNNESATNNAVKYSKLKRLFSGKNIRSPNSTCTSAATVASGAAPSAFRSRSRTQVDKGNCTTETQSIKCRKEIFEFINIDQMDPPLPVKKKMPKPDEGGESNNLWKRRSAGGVALTSLQLNHTHILAHHPEATTV